ncbi:MAG: FG-GAP repeat protein, partial [Planctomycetota bacterium]
MRVANLVEIVRVLAVGLLLASSPSPALAQCCETARLSASDAAPGDRFGFAVAVCGDYAVVGAPYLEGAGSDPGAAYVLFNDNGAWVEVARLTASDAAARDAFGLAAACDGDYVIVGAPKNDDAGSESGSAYIFVKPPDGWQDMTETQKLTASDAGVGDGFGLPVSISGDYAVVGAYGDNDGGENSGSAYVFRRDDNGTPGDLSDDVWAEVAKLTASDAAAHDAFGKSAAIGGDYVVVGAYGNDDADPGGSNCRSGSAYIFEKPPGGWHNMTETQKLTASDAACGDHLGSHGGGVSIGGECAVIGAVGDDGETGSAYVFCRCDGTWVEVDKLTASDRETGDRFGNAVSISGGLVVIGAYWDDDACPADPGCNSGSAYVFHRDDNGTPGDLCDDAWGEFCKLTASDAAAGDQFGNYGVSVDGDYALIGALYNDDACTSGISACDSGSAYVYVVSGPDCNTNGIPDECDIANVGVD